MKVGGKNEKKLFFPHFFLPSFVNIKRHRTTRKKSQHSSEIQITISKKKLHGFSYDESIANFEAFH